MTPESTAGRVVVVGATGFTGGLVARELAESDADFVLTGRSSEKVSRLGSEVGGAETAVVDVTEPASLRRVLKPGDVVINCAGPFTELGEGVVESCVGEGAHYLDTTGEQRFMERIYRRWDARAREAGVVVVNAMAFEYALGDAASALALRALPGGSSSVDVTYAWQPAADATSPGTRASVLKVLLEPGLTYVDGDWREERVARHARAVELPGGARRRAVSFPAGEIVTVPRHADVEDVRAWMVTGSAAALAARLAGPLLPPLARLLSPLLERVARRGAEGPDPQARRETRFTIVADARAHGPGAEVAREAPGVNADAGRARTVVTGVDPYGLTAALITASARTVVDRADRAHRADHADWTDRERGQDPDPDAPPAGVLAPSQLIPPRSLLDGLAERGLEWHVETCGDE